MTHTALTAERRAEIRARHQALTDHTTAGDWRYDGDDSIHVFPSDGQAELVASVWGEPDSTEERALGEWIAHSRRDVPDLLAEVEQLSKPAAAYVSGDGDGYLYLRCADCKEIITCIDAGSSLAGLNAEADEHTCLSDTGEAETR